MKLLVVALALVALCEGRPRKPAGAIPALTTDIGTYIIGGVDAAYGQWPWQVSFQRGGGANWGHSCGGSVLRADCSLTAAHCVDGGDPGSMRVVAGLHWLSNMAGSQATGINWYRMHPGYNNGQATYANDIATLAHNGWLNIGGNVQTANLPPNNDWDYAGQWCQITGWGRNSDGGGLPDQLQMADIQVISSNDCNNWVGGIWGGHICVYDSFNTRGACNGDSGGPINCNYVVVGVASFVFVSGGNCLPTLPSAYTRVSAYLDWIYGNMP